MSVPKAVVYRTDSLATCEPDDPTRPSCREFQTTQPTIHLPSSYGLTNPTSFFCILLLKDTAVSVATSASDSRMRLSEGTSMCMINSSKPGHSLQDCRLSQLYCLEIPIFSVNLMFIGPCNIVITEEYKSHLLHYCTSYRLNMFRALLCPSAGARDYDVDYHIGRFVLGLL